MSEIRQFQMTLAEIAQACDGRHVGNNIVLNGVSTDTRSLQAGEFYIALRGPNFDGHDFIPQAIEQGAAAVMVEHVLDADIPAVIVADTHLALGRLAQAWRSRFDIPIVAVTGSNGKTTVKEMLATIFSELGQVHATKGNLNNDIGVPLTLFRLGQQHHAAVIEMGANHKGEIAYLVDIAQPDVAIVTNAGDAHLEGFGSLQGVAEAKGEIFQGLSGEGIAIINADDPFAELWRDYAAPRRVLTFALEHAADVSATYQSSELGNVLLIKTAQGEVEVSLALLGRHNVMNALAATAAALACQVSLSQIKSGLEKLHAVPGRLQLKQGVHGSRLIDDTYNANPSSVKAALEVLSGFAGEHYLALGDMGELGSNEEVLHRQVGEQARQQGVRHLYTMGKLAQCAAEVFGERAYSFDAQGAMIAALHNDLHKDVTLLVKGSRTSHMERVVEALTTEKGV